MTAVIHGIHSATNADLINLFVSDNDAYQLYTPIVIGSLQIRPNSGQYIHYKYHICL